MERPSSAIPWTDSNKRVKSIITLTLEEETIERFINNTPRRLRESLKTAFNGGILKHGDKKRIAFNGGISKHEDKKRIASKSRIIASKKHSRIALKKKRVVTNVIVKHNKQGIANWFNSFQLLLSTSTTMTPWISKMESETSTKEEPSKPKLESDTSTKVEHSKSKFESDASTKLEPSKSKFESDASTKVEPSKSKLESDASTTVKPSTPIPKAFEWIRATSTYEERCNFRQWAHSKADEIRLRDPDESDRLLRWSNFLFKPIVQYPEPEVYKTFLGWALTASTKKAPDERKRLFKWAHSTAGTAPDERKRWSLQEEILKAFETALEHVQSEIDEYARGYALNNKENYALPGFPKLKVGDYPHVNQEHIIYTFKGKHGLYECRNALWIWTKYLHFPRGEIKRGPIYFGEKIKDYFPESDMTEGRPSVNELGFVTIELSGKWIAESIHKMLKDGLYTWAPKLPVERVFVDRPSSERINLDLARRFAITYTLMSILEFSNVDSLVIRGHYPMCFEAQLNIQFPFEEREGDGLINGQISSLLPKRDSKNAYKDIFALGNRLCGWKADWIVFITPVWHRVYSEMCLAAAELEKWIPIDNARTSYAGYQACNTAALEDNLLDKARTRLGRAAQILGYSAEAILECVLKYTSLKNHRLAVCTFDINEMLNEEGNTFLYLLNTRAKLRRVTDDYREDIIEVKEASELKFEKDKSWEKGEERVLGFHLLEFTEALEESCLSVLPHILCEYVYDLSKKFNRYHSSVCKDGFVVETSTLLLYEATAVVIEQCFRLLGILPTCKFFFSRSVAQPPSDLFTTVERPMNVNARDPHRNSRFQPFTFFTKPMTSMSDGRSKLFGLISLSSNHGLLSDGGSYFFEPDFAHVPLFNYDWCNPIDMVDGENVYLGSPAVPLSSFTPFISARMELYVTKKNECYQVCNQNKVIDLSDFFAKKLDGECGCLSVDVKEGDTRMYYILLKDAVDTAVEITLKTSDNLGRSVRGYVLAYYGDEFLLKCQSKATKDCYYALLFLPKPPYFLQSSEIPQIKSQLAVPATGSLIVKAYLQDCNARKLIINGSCKFKAQLGDCSFGTIRGDGCSLELKVNWNYQDKYL